MDDLKVIAETVQKKFGKKILSLEEIRGDITLLVSADSIVDVCEFLRDDPATRFDLLIALTAIDFWPNEPRFHMVYELFSLESKLLLGLRVPIAGEKPWERGL